MQKILILLFIILSTQTSQAQEVKKLPVPMDSLYQANIKKSKLYGVYIPRDVDDALSQLMKLTDEDARNKLKKTDEKTMAKKLHFGLGRWMEYNWNFVEGSRFSHHLRELGLFNHDDMVQFMLITFHRHISGKPLRSDELMQQLIKEREEKIKNDMATKEVISVLPGKN